MATSVKQMMEAANAAVPKITPAQAKEMIAKGNTLVVDVRDGTEVAASGKAAGAVHVSARPAGVQGRSRGADARQGVRQVSKTVILLLRIGRARGARRQALEGSRLREGLQHGRLQDWGRQRRPDRQVDAETQALRRRRRRRLSGRIGLALLLPAGARRWRARRQERAAEEFPARLLPR